MKVLIKILLVIAAVGGVLYWLMTKFATPARRLWAYHTSRRQPDVDELVEKEDESTSDSDEPTLF